MNAETLVLCRVCRGQLSFKVNLSILDALALTEQGWRVTPIHLRTPAEALT